MLVFVDDSGDPGFKLDKGSSKFFVISCVIFDDELEAEKTAVAIKELRRALKFPDSVEFKFNKSSRVIREKFLTTINKYKFRVRSIIFEKSVIRSPELRENKRSFYSYAIKTLIEHSGDSISDAKLKIDGSGDRVFRRDFVAYLRRELNFGGSYTLSSCKLVNSKSNVLIQMADMVAGSTRRYYDNNKSDSKIYRNIFKKHIENDWRFR